MSVKETMYQMFQQRNYTEIREENHSFIATKKEEENIIGFYDIIEKLNTEELKNCIHRAQNHNVKHIILVYKEKTPQVKAVENFIDNIEIKIELFVYVDLLVNVTKHELVPKHEIASLEEKLEVKNKIGLTNLPILLKSDPISRFYGYDKGTLIKITRKNGHIAYRIVR